MLDIFIARRMMTRFVRRHYYYHYRRKRHEDFTNTSHYFLAAPAALPLLPWFPTPSRPHKPAASFPLGRVYEPHSTEKRAYVTSVSIGKPD